MENSVTLSQTQKEIKENFDVLFNKYVKIMKHLGFYNLEVVEESVSHALLIAYDNYTYGKVKLSTYVINIAKNHYITQYRKESQNLPLNEAIVGNPVDNDLSFVIDNDRLTEVIKIMLTKFEYKIFCLYIEGYSGKEISKVTNVNTNNIRVKINRILTKLQDNKEAFSAFV